MAKILVVDDEEMVRKVCARTLARAGHEIIQASNGQEGLERTLNDNPDLILTDVRMPVMGGAVMTQLLREQGFTKPIILMSGDTGEQTALVETLVRDGLISMEVLEKPFIDISILARAVEMALRDPS